MRVRSDRCAIPPLGLAEIHLFLRTVGHKRVFALWIDVNQDQLTLLDGHQAETQREERKKYD